MRYVAQLLTWEESDDLPGDLGGDRGNTYSTMLFNDEVHTYEQVISTLQRAVECSHKEAIDFATTVDREVSQHCLVPWVLRIWGISRSLGPLV